MKIAHFLSQHELTGAEAYACTLINEQVSNGHTVYQISNGFFKPSRAERIQIEVETKSFITFWKNVFKIRQFIKEKNIQVIHTHSRAAAKLAFYSRFFLKVGMVSSVHGRQHVSLSKKIVNQYGDFTIPVCDEIQKQLVTEFKYNKRFIKIVPNGLDPKIFSFQKVQRFIPGSELKIAIIGRRSGPKKERTDLFIKHFSEILKNKGIQFSIELIGVGPDKIKDINSELIHQYHLICGSGRVCIEALLSGVPCIAFGEHRYLGVVTTNQLQEFAKSNFGDIGPDFKPPTFDFNKAQHDADIILENLLSEKELFNLSQMTQNQFSTSVVTQKIQRIYESAYFYRNYPHWIPILMYHKVPDQPLDSQHKIFVTKNNFEKHLQFFKKNNFTTLTFNELSLFRKAQKNWNDFPKKPLILTFDDGYKDNLENVNPLLKKHNFKAHIYLLADSKVDHNHWDTQNDNSQNSKKEYHPIVSLENRKQWLQSEFIIGSHGLRHDRLPLMNWNEKINELTTSKSQLESEFGVPVNSYAYTYGDTNVDCAEACEMSGYEYGLNTDTGGLTIEENPYSIFRVNIFPDETTSLFSSLWKKTSKWYRRYYYYKRNK